MSDTSPSPLAEMEQRASITGWLRRPLFQWTALGTVGALFGLVIFLIWLWGLTVAEHCWEVTSPDYSMEEVIALRERVRTYQGDTNPDAWLAMDPAEVTFLLDGATSMGLQLAAREDRVMAIVSISRKEGCYNITYEGTANIEQGLLRLVPTRVAVGELDISWAVAGQTWEVVPDQIPDEKLQDQLKNTARLKVENGRFRLQWIDRWDLW